VVNGRLSMDLILGSLVRVVVSLGESSLASLLDPPHPPPLGLRVSWLDWDLSSHSLSSVGPDWIFSWLESSLVTVGPNPSAPLVHR